jgi:hypothetical protein
MTYTSKTCPKCSKEMGRAESVMAIPAATHPSSFSDPISTTAGFPVVLYCCAGYSYVELCRQQM